MSQPAKRKKRPAGLILVPPHAAPGGRCWYVHGTWLGVPVRRSTRTADRALAAAELRRIKRDIERARFDRHGDQPAAAARPAGFADAALGYLKDCPASQLPMVRRLLDHFADTPLAAFDKDLIDAGEAALYPGRLERFAAGTLNRMYRAPLAAVLHHAARRNLMPWLKVEKYAEATRTAWLEPEQAAALIAAAAAGDARRARWKSSHGAALAPLLILCFTSGLRIGEAIALTWADVDLPRRHIILRDTKNGQTYGVHLHAWAFDAIANLPHHGPGARHPQRRVFGYASRFAPRTALRTACKAAGLTTGAKGQFTMHVARHSFATWLRRAGHDLKAIMELGRWKSPRAALRYQHVASHEHAAAIAALPLTAPAESQAQGTATVADQAAAHQDYARRRIRPRQNRAGA